MILRLGIDLAKSTEMQTDALSKCTNPTDCSHLPAEENELPCTSCKKCLKLAELMWSEIPVIPTVVHGQPYGESSWTSRILSIGIDPHYGADECQQF